MIAPTKPRPKRLSTRVLHTSFLAMLPAIRRLALIAFRDLDPEAKAEGVQEVTANSFVAFHRLAELGKTVIKIDSDHYGRVEDAHMFICHLLTYVFMENAAGP